MSNNATVQIPVRYKSFGENDFRITVRTAPDDCDSRKLFLQQHFRFGS
jgi:hypothetical protein